MDGDPSKRPTSLDIVETIKNRLQRNSVCPGDTVQSNKANHRSYSKLTKESNVNLLSSHLVTFSTPKLKTTDPPIATFTFAHEQGKPRFLISGVSPSSFLFFLFLSSSFLFFLFSLSFFHSSLEEFLFLLFSILSLSLSLFPCSLSICHIFRQLPFPISHLPYSTPAFLLPFSFLLLPFPILPLPLPFPLRQF